MSEHASKLCVLIVDYLLGELSSRVLQALFLSGRLNFPTLLRQTVLTPRQLRHSLAVLVQENLVLWYTSAEDGSTSYEANQITCYSLLRSGKYLAIVEDRLEEPALEMVSDLIAHGYTSAGALIQTQLFLNDGRLPKKSLANGFKSADAEARRGGEREHRSFDSLQGTLCDLIQAGIIQLTHESDFRPFADNRIEAEKLEPHRDALKAKMKQAEALVYNEAISDRLHDWKHGTEAQRAELSNLQGSKKRKIQSLSNEVGKRPRLSTESSITNGDDLREDVTLRINHDKLLVIDRNQHLVDLAEASIGTLTSQIYAVALSILERDQMECKKRTLFSDDVNAVEDDPLPRDLPQFSTNDLKMEINLAADSNLKEAFFPGSTDLADNLGHVDASEINMTQYEHRKKRRRKNLKHESDDDSDDIQVAGFASPDEDESTEDDGDGNVSGVDTDPEDLLALDDFHPVNANPRKRGRSHSSAPPKPPPSPLSQHLLLLAHHPYKFLHHLPATLAADERWSVDVHALSKHLLRHALLQTITAKFGPLAARLVRILCQKGKVEEKNLAADSLIHQKTARLLLSTMNVEGFIEFQGVPKDTQHAPHKTLYLWFFDEERCRKRVLDMTYKTMCRILQRISVEKAKVKETVEKSERVDVQGHEDEFLGEGEKEALAGWRAREERLLGELMRLDDLVAVLRDF